MGENNSTVRKEIELRELHELRINIEEALSPKVVFTPDNPEAMREKADEIITTRLLSMLGWVTEAIG